MQVMNELMPESSEEFFKFVIPLLQHKGLVQREYRPTLREKLFGTSSDISERHRAPDDGGWSRAHDAALAAAAGC
jgi:hypothetical protein